LYINVHSSVHNSQKEETTLAYTNRRLDMENVGYTYNEMLCNYKEEWSSDSCCNNEKKAAPNDGQADFT
jgi:hypothetical protein